ncbi:right-handed parallel beta-helix repeat-containing protein [Thalassotalea fonticola]|uniref:Right-handed parallel beta-helix repeat-containing protein n=1 Tax=Thalassotalea fonticola TaxID=3065649 RepID=A0ABZ0GID7_9GAMM|nr:right-handed parallel beta-helix repeat-containing protein [Colwelliaceae bacterium S1-1]
MSIFLPRSSLFTFVLILTSCSLDTTVDENNSVLTHTVIHISPTGTSRGNGSISKPLNSLHNARDKIRQLKLQGVKGSFEVRVAQGDYLHLQGLTLYEQDSGTAESPITYRAVPGAKARFFGGKILDATAFYPLDKQSQFARRLIEPDAIKHIKVIDLKQQGINGVDELGKLISHAWGLEPSNRVPPAMITIGGERMSLARWPNADALNPYFKVNQRIEKIGLTHEDFRGFTSFTKVIDKGLGKHKLAKNQRKYGWENSAEFMNGGGTVEVEFDRMRYWQNSGNIFIDGVVSSSWEWTYNRLRNIDVEKKQFTLEMGAALTGVGDKLKASHFFFDNVAEELDQPGEYFINRETGLLYLYPPADFQQKPIVLSALNQHAISAAGVNYVRFENLTFDTGRNLFAEFINSSGIEIVNNTLVNFVKGGIDIKGSDNLIQGNEISGIGGYGVRLDGGNLKTLKSANNVVEYNHIHNFGWDQRSQIPAIYINGVGNRVANNKVHDGPHFAIRIKGGNDNIVEYNEIFDVVKYHKFDGGALYIYNTKQPEQRGNIIRKNYFHDIPNQRFGVYIDNHSMGMRIEDNLFINVEAPVNINSGHHNQVNRNIMVNCPTPIRISKFSFHNAYNKDMKHAWQKKTNAYLTKLNQLPHHKYASFKEWLAMTDVEKRKGVSFGQDNIFYNPDIALDKRAKRGIEDQMKTFVSTNNLVLQQDPGFTDISAGDYSINANLNPAGFSFDLQKVGLAGREAGAR